MTTETLHCAWYPPIQSPLILKLGPFQLHQIKRVRMLYLVAVVSTQICSLKYPAIETIRIQERKYMRDVRV